MELQELIALYSTDRSNQNLLHLMDNVDANAVTVAEARELWMLSTAAEAEGCEVSLIDAKGTHPNAFLYSPRPSIWDS